MTTPPPGLEVHGIATQVLCWMIRSSLILAGGMDFKFCNVNATFTYVVDIQIAETYLTISHMQFAQFPPLFLSALLEFQSSPVHHADMRENWYLSIRNRHQYSAPCPSQRSLASGTVPQPFDSLSPAPASYHLSPSET